MRREDVGLVINSHLHWDHCGGNRLFPHCPIVVQRAELGFARAPSGPVRGGYMANHFDVAVTYRPVDGDQEVAPGVRVLATHGHTPGHLRGLGARGATVLPGHEPTLWDRLGPPPVRFG